MVETTSSTGAGKYIAIASVPAYALRQLAVYLMNHPLLAITLTLLWAIWCITAFVYIFFWLHRISNTTKYEVRDRHGRVRVVQCRTDLIDTHYSEYLVWYSIKEDILHQTTTDNTTTFDGTTNRVVKDIRETTFLWSHQGRKISDQAVKNTIINNLKTNYPSCRSTDTVIRSVKFEGSMYTGHQEPKYD